MLKYIKNSDKSLLYFFLYFTLLAVGILFSTNKIFLLLLRTFVLLHLFLLSQHKERKFINEKNVSVRIKNSFDSVSTLYNTFNLSNKRCLNNKVFFQELT